MPGTSRCLGRRKLPTFQAHRCPCQRAQFMLRVLGLLLFIQPAPMVRISISKPQETRTVRTDFSQYRLQLVLRLDSPPHRLTCPEPSVRVFLYHEQAPWLRGSCLLYPLFKCFSMVRVFGSRLSWLHKWQVVHIHWWDSCAYRGAIHIPEAVGGLGHRQRRPSTPLQSKQSNVSDYRASCM